MPARNLVCRDWERWIPLRIALNSSPGSGQCALQTNTMLLLSICSSNYLSIYLQSSDSTGMAMTLLKSSCNTPCLHMPADNSHLEGKKQGNLPSPTTWANTVTLSALSSKLLPARWAHDQACSSGPISSARLPTQPLSPQPLILPSQ